MNLLIPYKYLVGHNDPYFEEYTYGDVRRRARKLKKLKKGDYLFFHTGDGGKRYITAYYVVDRVLNVSEVIKDKNISAKYKNPHIDEYKSNKSKRLIDNVIVFGDPITSKLFLERPLLFNKELAKKLSLRIPFPRGGRRTEAQAISSATRSWRELNNKDIKILFGAIKEAEKTPVSNDIISTEEVTEVLERDLENFIQKKPQHLIGHSTKVIKRQCSIPAGRMDLLLLQDRHGNLIVVELKLRKIGHDAVGQIQRYMRSLEKTERGKKVSGIIVCQGVLPTFEKDFRKLKNIKIFCYGWQLEIYPWRSG
jgi:hypothetical protein